MGNWKGTKGEFKVDNFSNVYTERHGKIEIIYASYGHTGQQNANATLIADAFNTIQQCGLMPSDLLKQLQNTSEENYKLLEENKKLFTKPNKEEIDNWLDEYAFQVPYDGSNKFYNEEKLKHAKEAIDWVISSLQPIPSDVVTMSKEASNEKNLDYDTTRKSKRVS